MPLLVRSIRFLLVLPLLLLAAALQAQTVVTASPTGFTNIIPNAPYALTYTVTNNTGDEQDYTFTNGSCTLDEYEAFVGVGGHTTVHASCVATTANGSGNFTLRTFGTTTVNKAVPWTTGASRMQFTGPGGSGVASVTVHAPRPVIRATFTPVSGDNFDTTTTLVEIGTPAAWTTADQNDITSLTRYNHGLLEVELDSTYQLAAGDTQKVRVTRCTTGGLCVYTERLLVLANDQTPYVDMTAMRLGHSGGSGGTSFGPGIAISGLDVETGFATPAYVSVGAARSAALSYSTRTSYPRARLAANVSLPWPAGTPDTVKAVLIDSGAVRRDSVVLASPSCATGATKVCRIVLQADYSAAMISGGISRRWLKMEVTVKSAGTTKIATDSAEVVLVDRRDSPYGSGWWPSAGVKLVAAGGDRLLVGADGSTSIYRGFGDSLFLATPGETNTLVKVTTGFELRARGSTAKVVFDTAGRVIKSIDASGNRDSVVYDGSGRVSTLVDPIGKTIVFYYGSVTGKLDSLVSLPSSGGKRATRVSIDTATNQLRYDSLSSSASNPVIGHFAYLTYGSVKGTSQLQDRWGRFGGDSVRIVYDTATRSRPTQARLLRPNATDSVPVLTYKAAELQGWHAVRSLDSLYEEVADPLKHWTRSRMNRWGESEFSWDSLGTLSRTNYDPIGRVVWSEGKNADSSRVYMDYDSMGRLARSYVLRSGMSMLRLDSLTYDASSRVSKTIDSRGKVDSVAYDSAGRVIYHKDPAGAVTHWTWQSDGQLASTLAPNTTGSSTVSYDATFHNAFDWFDPSGQEVSVIALDSMGRGMYQQGMIRVHAHGLVQWEARRTTSYLDPAGRADSTTVGMSGFCADPCDDPPTDFTTIQVMKPTRDSLGRTTQMQIVGTNASTETFNFDHLGRVIGHGAVGGGRDSLVYDLVGNVIKSITRRGDTLSTSYDSRNRATASVIPGYGTVQSTYGGPQDQLTLLHVSGYADATWGVNPDRGFAYDQRGRLVRDSLWTGPVTRTAVHTYDSYDRPSTVTDTLGVWTVQYDTTRGMVARLIAPTGDTLGYAYDSLARPSAATLARGTSSHLPQGSLTYSGTGELMTLGDTLLTSGAFTGYNGGKWQQVGTNAGNNFGVGLTIKYTKQDGSGAGTETQVDSLIYDGLGRLLQWKGMKNGSLLTSESYSMSNDGNLTIGGTTPTFASGSNRLTVITRTGGAKSAYTYDTAGNLIQRDDSLSGAFTCSWQYGYNALGRMDSVSAKAPGGSYQLVARYAYDVTGERIARKVYTTVAGCSSAATGYTRYAVRGGQVQYETDSAGSGILRRYVWAPGTDNLVGVQVGSSTDSMFYAVKDKIGSVRAWVRKDGTWRWGMRYRPYGTPLDSSGTALDAPYRWTGREYDPETGFYYLRARYYDPTIGRFMQEDPLGTAGSANLYAYTDGHPLEATDPSGMLYEWSGMMDPECSITSGMCYGWDGTAHEPGGTVGQFDGGDFGGQLQAERQAFIDYTQADANRMNGLNSEDPAARVLQDDTRALDWNEFKKVFDALNFYMDWPRLSDHATQDLAEVSRYMLSGGRLQIASGGKGMALFDQLDRAHPNETTLAFTVRDLDGVTVLRPDFLTKYSPWQMDVAYALSHEFLHNAFGLEDGPAMNRAVDNWLR